MNFVSATPLKIAVIKGGTSLEREISLESGGAVANALRDAGHTVTEIDLKVDSLPEKLGNFDCVFPVLHGTFGEDGQFQKLLEKENICFVGCGSETSHNLMDKDQTAKIAELNGIRMPKGLTIFDKNSKIPENLKLPLIVKPASQGSSFGLSLVKKAEEWEEALEKVFQSDMAAIVQEFIQGTEIAVGVVLGKAMPVVEIIPPGELFDKDAKYDHKLGETQYNCPPSIVSQEVQKIAQKLAVECFDIFNCRDMTRMDFIIQNEIIYFIEGNTIPGFTASSLLPKSAAVNGTSFPELCDTLVQAANKRKGQ